MGTLPRLDNSANGIPSEQKKSLEHTCTAGGIELDI
jgi:hypothetical protein